MCVCGCLVLIRLRVFVFLPKKTEHNEQRLVCNRCGPQFGTGFERISERKRGLQASAASEKPIAAAGGKPRSDRRMRGNTQR